MGSSASMLKEEIREIKDPKNRRKAVMEYRKQLRDEWHESRYQRRLEKKEQQKQQENSSYLWFW